MIVAIMLLSGCGGTSAGGQPRPAASALECAELVSAERRAWTQPSPSPDLSACQSWRLPLKFAFRCMSGGFDPDFAMNEGALQALVERLREMRGVRRIQLEGLISRRGPERYDGVRRSHGDNPRRLSPEELAHRLAQRRAEGVRAALIGEGFDPSIIEAIGRDDELALDHREECLPPNEDVGSWQRYVRVNVVVCETPPSAR